MEMVSACKVLQMDWGSPALYKILDRPYKAVHARITFWGLQTCKRMRLHPSYTQDGTKSAHNLPRSHSSTLLMSQERICAQDMCIYSAEGVAWRERACALGRSRSYRLSNVVHVVHSHDSVFQRLKALLLCISPF